MKVVLILYNVKAGHGKIARKIDKIGEAFRRGGYEPLMKLLRFGENPFTKVSGDIDLVVVCGGDGTINYVINAMKSVGKNIPLGIIPAGTANDFAGAIGMKNNPLKAVEQIINGKTRKLDCGRVNEQYFINVLSFGLFTTTSQHTPDAIKHRIGKAAYLIEGAKELQRREYIPITIEHDHGTTQIDSLTTLIFNGRTAGRIRMARNAKIDDGLLDCVIIRRCCNIKIFWGLLCYLISGRTNSVIKHIRSTKLTISSELSPLTDMDGQTAPELPLSIECIKEGLLVKCP